MTGALSRLADLAVDLSLKRLVADEIRRGTAPDENLMQAMMMFNTYVRDGSAVECDDDEGEGYAPRYGRS